MPTDIYVTIDGPQGAGDGSSWANSMSFASALASAGAGVHVHVRHHSLKADGTPSGASAYNISSNLTVAAGGSITDPFAVLGYDSNDNVVTSFDDMPVFDGAALSSGDAITIQDCNVWHGLKFQNFPDDVLRNTGADYCFFSYIWGKDNTYFTIYAGRNYNRACMCRVEGGSGGIFFGNYGAIIACEAINMADSDVFRVTSYGIVAFCSGAPGKVYISTYSLAAFNTLNNKNSTFPNGTLQVVGSNFTSLFGNVTDSTIYYSNPTVNIRNAIVNTSYPSAVAAALYDTLANPPGFSSASLPDFTNQDLLTPLSDVSDIILGGWQPKTGGGGGWRPRTLWHGF
ncbi:MAG: hypothetical protein D6706_15925 [Chloroflexi bacterium]|nr:MAG: hypothetical protein D6706_15925 [Chloroflexota bacterium]